MKRPTFTDSDLHTPAHDAIMLWLDSNAELVLRKTLGVLSRFEDAKRKALGTLSVLLGADIRRSEEFDRLMVASDTTGNVETTWEMMTTFRGGARFIDMNISGTFDVPYVYPEYPEPGRSYSLKPPEPIYYNAVKSAFHVTLNCEIKPVIRSVGELVRQLRQYENSDNKETIRLAVVSSDTRFQAIIQKQGFLFVTAPQPDCGPQAGLF